MGGRRTTRQEMEQIEALTKEGLTTREIAERLNRSEAAIRNLRYKKRLAPRLQDETAVLLKQKFELTKSLKTLQNQKASLVYELNNLNNRKQTIEAALRIDKVLLEQTLAKALIGLKQQRPDLFYMTGADQIVMILKAILG
jgi:IS30 family transposase